VYDYVVIPAKLAPIVDSPMFQRLRRVAQTSLTNAVYPGSTGSRFEHSLGSMHLAGLAWDAAWGNAAPEVQDEFITALSQEVRELPLESKRETVRELRTAVMAVGLLHDLGHPPFSHALEELYRVFADRLLGMDAELHEALSSSEAPFHEFAGEWILSHHLSPLLEEDPTLKNAVPAIYSAPPEGTSPTSVLHGIVAGELDVDRLDYLMRDGRKAGTEFAAIDWKRFVEGLQLRPYGDGYRIAPNVSARSAAETIMVQRTQSYRWMIFHHRVVASNLALTSAVELLLELEEMETPVAVGDLMVTPAQLFRPLLGNLDYLSPGAGEFSSLSDRVVPTGGAGDSVLLGELFSSSIARTRLALSAGVDDSRVVRTLLDARVIAEAFREESQIDESVRRLLDELLAYIDASMFRRKNVVPVWKTESHFAQIAVRLKEKLRRIVSDTFQVLSDGGLEVAEFQAALSESLKIDFGAEVKDARAAPLLNWVMSHVLEYRHQRDRFEQQLDDHWSGELRGLWRCAETSFSALARGPKAGIVWDEKGRPMKLSAASALVAGLDEVEAQRNQFGLFFFLRYPQTMNAWDSASVRTLRYLLTGQFVEDFPGFAAEELPVVLRPQLE